MTKKSFGKLYADREVTPAYHSQELAVTFLSELTAAMKAQGINNAELARRISASPAYITKVFRGPSNLSVESIAKLAMALGCKANLHLKAPPVAHVWRDVARDVRSVQRSWPAHDEAYSMSMAYPPASYQDTSNDEKFALAA
jgi:transcriptional regulator with XRE-family HTH domain